MGLGRNIWNNASNIRDAKFADFRIYNQALESSNASGTWRLADDNLYGEIIETLNKLRGDDNPAITNFTVTNTPGLMAGYESVASGATVATMSAVAGGIPAFTYALVTGEGSDNNNRFAI